MNSRIKTTLTLGLTAFFLLGALDGFSSQERANLDLGRLMNAQKKSYLERNWDAFFGTAQVYRLAWWNEVPSVTLIALEALALARHCRYAEAELLIATLGSHSSARRGETEAIQQVKHLLTSVKKLGIQAQENSSLHISSRANPEVFWPIQNLSLWKRLPPTSFRVHMESKCRLE